MLTDVGPVELWATRWRRPSAAANPQGFCWPATRRLTHFVTRVMLICLIHWPRRGESAGTNQMRQWGSAGRAGRQGARRLPSSTKVLGETRSTGPLMRDCIYCAARSDYSNKALVGNPLGLSNNN